jgi:hypothetical protein
MIKINMMRPKWSGHINGKDIRIMHVVPDWATSHSPTAYDLEYQWREYWKIFGKDVAGNERD